MSEITDNGYIVKNQNEWFDEEQQLYLDIDPNWNLDPSTPDGLKIAHDSEIFGNLDELLQRAYNSKDPNAATGVELDIICAITGTFRKLGTPSQATVTLSGVVGTLVGAGVRIKSSVDNTEWTVDQNVTIDVTGTIDVGVTCTVLGAIQADPNTLTIILDTVGGLESVTNALPATAGTERETDSQLRLRRNQLVALTGNNQIDNMLGSVGSVEGVRRFVIYENPTNATDSNGLPAHSIAVIVDGGTDDDIAQAIFNKKNPGVLLHPANAPITVNVTSELYPQNSQDITFSRPDYVDAVTVVGITNDGTLPANIVDLVKQAILDYTGGTLLDPSCGFNSNGFDIGEDIGVSRLYTPVNQVIGQYGNSYIDTLTVNTISSVVPIAFNELARFTEANITVVIT